KNPQRMRFVIDRVNGAKGLDIVRPVGISRVSVVDQIRSAFQAADGVVGNLLLWPRLIVSDVRQRSPFPSHSSKLIVVTNVRSVAVRISHGGRIRKSAWRA